MTVWIIEPQDPLIVRDGRPFHATPGARARSLPFPFPSTTAGGVRTRAGQDENGIFDTDKITDVKGIGVRGPLLAEIRKNDTIKFLVPAPADALVLNAEGKSEQIERKWLRPLAPLPGAQGNKPEELAYLVGLPIRLPSSDIRKPSKNAPAFWYWEQFQKWLCNPADDIAPCKPTELGHNGPQPDRRIHVGINPDTFTGLDGSLFATSGLEFWHREENNSLANVPKLALAVEVVGADSDDLKIDAGFAPLGGERRLVSWQKRESDTLPGIPAGLAQRIKKNGGYCRLILLTPAYFEAGWRPKFESDVQLLATAVSTPVVVSGWDFAKHKPKPTKRLAPAGSVYYVKVTDDVEQWVNNHWLQPLSDDLEMSKAGFGITAVGVWDGQAAELTIKERENA